MKATIAQRAGRETIRHDFPNGGAMGHWADKTCPYCDDRIRTLEAELAEVKNAGHEAVRVGLEMTARTEKSEAELAQCKRAGQAMVDQFGLAQVCILDLNAEVERLKAELGSHRRCHEGCHCVDEGGEHEEVVE